MINYIFLSRIYRMFVSMWVVLGTFWFFRFGGSDPKTLGSDAMRGTSLRWYPPPLPWMKPILFWWMCVLSSSLMRVASYGVFAQVSNSLSRSHWKSTLIRYRSPICITVTLVSNLNTKNTSPFFNAQHYSNQSMGILVHPIGTLGLAQWVTSLSMG